MLMSKTWIAKRQGNQAMQHLRCMEVFHVRSLAPLQGEAESNAAIVPAGPFVAEHALYKSHVSRMPAYDALWAYSI